MSVRVTFHLQSALQQYPNLQFPDPINKNNILAQSVNEGILMKYPPPGTHLENGSFFLIDSAKI